MRQCVCLCLCLCACACESRREKECVRACVVCASVFSCAVVMHVSRLGKCGNCRSKKKTCSMRAVGPQSGKSLGCVRARACVRACVRACMRVFDACSWGSIGKTSCQSPQRGHAHTHEQAHAHTRSRTRSCTHMHTSKHTHKHTHTERERERE